VPSAEKLLLKIEKMKPDIVVLDPALYEKVDGIEISRVIRSRFDVQVRFIEVD
jgi:DNA-binding response OmpR family regulator